MERPHHEETFFEEFLLTLRAREARVSKGGGPSGSAFFGMGACGDAAEL